MIEKTSLAPGSNFGRYCQTWLADTTFINSLLTQQVYPRALAGTGNEVNFVNLTLQRDLRILSHFQALETLEEMNRIFSNGQGQISYKFAPNQSGFSLQTGNPQFPELFIGVVKDPQLFDNGQAATLGLGFGYTYVDTASSIGYLRTARNGGLVDPEDPNASAAFVEVMLRPIQHINALQSLAPAIRIQGFPAVNNQNFQVAPVQDEDALRAAAAAYNQQVEEYGIRTYLQGQGIFPTALDVEMRRQQEFMDPSAALARRIDPFGFQPAQAPGAEIPGGSPFTQ